MWIINIFLNAAAIAFWCLVEFYGSTEWVIFQFHLEITIPHKRQTENERFSSDFEGLYFLKPWMPDSYQYGTYDSKTILVANFAYPLNQKQSFKPS